jgi:hypothetical protein
VVNFLPTTAIVVVSPCLSLLHGSGITVAIFGVIRVQLTQWEYFFPIYLAIPRKCVDSIFSLHLITSSLVSGFSIFNSFPHGPCNWSPPFPPSYTPFLSLPSICPIIVWKGRLPPPVVLRSTYPLVSYPGYSFCLFDAHYFFNSLDLGPVQIASAQVFTSSDVPSIGGGVALCPWSAKGYPY